MGDKDRRRAGDETRQRIDDLAGGWSVDKPAEPAAPAQPPPPPPAARAKRPSAAQPPPTPAAKGSASSPPPTPPAAARTKRASAAPPMPPLPAIDDTTAREDKLDPATLRADTARGDTGDNGGDDATRIDPDAGGAARAAATSGRHAPTGSVRAIASLPRKRGLGGDIRYVATVLFGITRSRRELTRIEAQLSAQRGKRRKRLIEIAARVLTDDDQRMPGVAEARDRLGDIEEERARQSGQAAAAEAEATAARRDHEAETKRLTAAIAAIEAELAELTQKLAPLERDAQAARKKATELKVTLERIAAKIASTEASVVTVKGARGDRAAVDAELATLRADRVAVQRDEPMIAAELDELLPRIAELEARRVAARARLESTRTALTTESEHLTERLGVVGAHHKVIDRALAASQTARENALADLGDRLVLDRPRSLSRDLNDIEAIDVDVAGDERRVMELHEVLGSVDRGALTRGIAVLSIAVAAVAALAIWLLVFR